MTAETVLVSVLAAVGIDAVSPQVSSDNIQLRQIVELMNETGKDLTARADWSRLFVSATVTGPTPSWSLPSDFLKLAESMPVRIGGATFKPAWRITSPEQWALLAVRPSVQPYFYLEGGLMNFAPALGAAGAVVRYLSRNWADGGDVLTQNGDEMKVPERLMVSGTVYRWRRQKGLPYDDFMAAHEAEIMDEIRMDRGAE